MYKPDKDTQKLKNIIDEEFRVKGYIRWPFVESFLKDLKKEVYKDLLDWSLEHSPEKCYLLDLIKEKLEAK